MRVGLRFLVLVLYSWWSTACAPQAEQSITLSLCASSVGREGELLRAQLQRFEAAHPNVKVRLEETPDAADQRHQLYVQWLNAKSPRPDVLQLDIIWTAEFAAAGWLLPLSQEPPPDEFFEATLRANTYRKELYALPWFVDVGMLYYRSDLADAPQTLAELRSEARNQLRAGNVRYGLVWQNARYEGLITSYLEVLGAFGGRWLDDAGQPMLDSPSAMRAAHYMRGLLEDGLVPREALGWQEEQTRFAFQNGQALFMRNWPYAYTLLEQDDSSVKGRFKVAPMPAAAGGSPTASLGGAQLGISRFTQHRQAALQLLAFLTAPEQMKERAQRLGQLPPRPSLFDAPELANVFGSPARSMRRIIEHARPRPPHPLYTELSGELQAELHRALSGQTSVEQALEAAQAKTQQILAAQGPAKRPRAETTTHHASQRLTLVLILLLIAACVAFVARGKSSDAGSRERRLLLGLLGPAVLVTVGVALLPLLATATQSLFENDLRTPWKTSTSPSLINFRRIFADSGFWSALQHTLFFLVVSVGLEICLGLALALALHRKGARANWARPLTLLPWAVPTVVVGLIFRFLVDGPDSLANQVWTSTGLGDAPRAWLSETGGAWTTVIVADVWKTTPFVALLLLAALTNIDKRLYEAAALDGAHRLQQLWHITLPTLMPTFLVVLLFRCLDALKVFDLIYTLTHGGPGTATEPLALYTFDTFFSHLKFGQGAALSLVSVLLALLLSLGFLRWSRLGRSA